MILKKLTCAFILIGCFANLSFAVPAGFNVQGRLTDANGINKEGHFNITFSIYAGPGLGGAVLWFKELPVDVTGGNFQVILQGEGKNQENVSVQLENVVKSLPAAYVEIKVGAESPLAPRQLLLRSPFQPVDLVGSVMWFYRLSCPEGFEIANGQSLLDQKYANLASVLGKSLPFNLPDLRGEFIRGVDERTDATKVDPDAPRAVGSVQLDTLQGHWHEHWEHGSTASASGPGSRLYLTGGNTTLIAKDAVRGLVPDDKGDGTPRTSAETRPHNVALLPCIKY